MTIEAMKQWLEALEKVLPCAEENFTNPSLQIEVINAYAAITSLRQAIEQAEKQEPIKIDGNTSDGYHTFNELYEFRKAYNVALFNEWAAGGKCSVHKSWRHHDGELCFGGGWFIVVAVLPDGQISNHYEAKDWDLFAIPEVERALFEFDGHTGNDVIERLEAYTTPPAAPVQEPVAWITHESKWRLTGGGNANGTAPVHAKKSNTAKYPLYTTPQPQPCPYIRSTREGTHHCALSQREWVGLTDDEIDKCCDFFLNALGMKHICKIEAKLKQKNGYAEEKNT